MHGFWSSMYISIYYIYVYNMSNLRRACNKTYSGSKQSLEECFTANFRATIFGPNFGAFL